MIETSVYFKLHATMSMIFTIFRYDRILESDAKYDDFLQTFSSFCIQSKWDVELFLLLISVRQSYRTTSSSYIRCDDDNSQWQEFIAFDAMTTARNDDFVTSWNKKKSVNFDDISQIVLSVLFATMISNYEMYIFSLFLRNRSFLQKFASLFDLKQRFLDKVDRKIVLNEKDNSILMLQFSIVMIFEAHVFVERSIQQTIKYQWFIEHD